MAAIKRLLESAVLCPRCEHHYIIPREVNGETHRAMVAVGASLPHPSMHNAYIDICAACRVDEENRFEDSGLLGHRSEWPIKEGE